MKAKAYTLAICLQPDVVKGWWWKTPIVDVGLAVTGYFVLYCKLSGYHDLMRQTRDYTATIMTDLQQGIDNLFAFKLN